MRILATNAALVVSRARQGPKRVLAATRGVHEHRLRAPPRSGQPEEQAGLHAVAAATMPRDALIDLTVDRDTGRRTLVAKRRFEAGEVLATDSPLIVWSQAEAGLLKAFQASDQQLSLIHI